MKREDRVGKAGQHIARSVLSGLGLEMIEQIGTPVRLIPINGNSQKTGVYRVIFGEKVAGDHRAMLPDGASVLIEVKTIEGRNLVWSDLREHQPVKLQEHTQNNGLTLLVWVHALGVAVMRWPIAGFGPGKGLTITKADQLDMETRAYIRRRLQSIARDQAEEGVGVYDTD